MAPTRSRDFQVSKARIGALVAVALFGSGCATVTSRFSQNVATAFAHDEMRKLETESLEVYYPAKHRKLALRIAARLQHCVQMLQSESLARTASDRVLVYVTGANFNNAYVQPIYTGQPRQMVLPEHVTEEFFNLLGLGAGEVGEISCHEAVHYVQFQQTFGFWRVVNAITGGTLDPNIFTEPWFLEGLAVHYEGKLGKPVGRPHSGIWRGLFESGVAWRGGRLTPADLSPANRDQEPFGGNYLVGMHFVDYLADKYGEEQLWKLIDSQGHSIFSPFGVTLRFKSVYGKSIGALFDDFSDELRAKLTPRQRPAAQQTVATELGGFARMAASPADGAMAVISSRRDDVNRLTIYERDGSVRFSRRLTQILPGRRWILVHPLEVSGMDFTADGAKLFMTYADVASDGNITAKLWEVDSRNGDVLRVMGPMEGFGGAIRPDGQRYVFVQMAGETGNLVEWDLSTDRRRMLTDFQAHSTLGSPSYSPDGKQIAFSKWTGEGFDLFLLPESGPPRQLTDDGAFNYAPRWLDQGRLIFLRETQGRVQAHLFDLQKQIASAVTDAPYVALDPAPIGEGRIALLNREGWSWTLDTTPIAKGEAIPLASNRLPASENPPADSVTVLKDAPYSHWDHLFAPTLRAPFFWLLQDPNSNNFNRVIAAFSLQGSDRLGFHNYAANLEYDSYDAPKDVSVSVGYGNYQLAPWFLSIVAGRGRSDPTTDLTASLSASRTFWTTPVSFTFLALDRKDVGADGYPAFRSRFVGGGPSISYSAAERSSYGGTQRGLRLSGAARYFPPALANSYPLGDLRGEVEAWVPLPLWRRHELSLRFRERTLLGAPAGLLRVGGFSSAYLQQSFGATHNGGDVIGLPAGIGFSETLRGYEDYRVRGTRAAIAGARYQYHFIVDQGTASLVYLLPSFFLRQIDLDLFVEGAWLNNPAARTHRAAGGALFIRTTLGGLPISLFYQLAGRFDDRLKPLHLFGLSLS